MQQRYDGSLIFNTKIDSSGFNKGTSKLTGILSNIGKAFRNIGSSSNKAFETARLKAQDVEIEMAAIRKKMEEIKNSTSSFGYASNKSFIKAKENVESYKKVLADLYAKRDELAKKKIEEATPEGVTPGSDFIERILSKDKDVQAIEKEISQVEAKLETYKVKLEEAKKAGSGMTEEAQKELNALEKKLEKLNVKLAQYHARMGQAKGGASKFTKINEKLKNLFKGVSSETKKANTGLSQFAKMFKRILLRLLILAAIRAVFKSVAEGIANLAQVSDSLNATLSDLQTSFLYLKNSLATAFMPALQALAPVITDITNKLAELFNMVGMVTARLFGGAATITKAKKAQVDYAKSLDKTGAAAKKAEGNLASFDELNILKEDTGGAGTGMPAPQDMFEEVEITDSAMTIADNIKGMFDEIKIAAQPAIEAFKRLWEAFSLVKYFTATTFIDFYERFLKPVGSWVLGEGIPRFLDAITKMIYEIDFSILLDALNRLWDALTPFAVNVGKGLLWFWENALMPLTKWTINKVVATFLDLLSVAIKMLDTAINILKPAARFLWDNFLKPIAEWTGGMILEVLELLKEAFGIVTEWIVEHGDEINDTFIAIGEALTVLWTYIVKPTLNLLKDLFRTVFRTVLITVLDVIGDVIKVFKGLADFITGVFTGDWERAIEGIVAIFDGVFSGIGDIVKGVVNTVIELINSMMSAMTSGINFVIRSLNSLSWEVPDWVPFIGGETWGFSIKELKSPTIPRLATGAVIPPNSEFLAILGDQRSGRNIEAPESLIRKIIREELSDYGGSEEINITMPVYLDNEKIYQGQKKMQFKHGKALVEGAI